MALKDGQVIQWGIPELDSDLARVPVEAWDGVSAIAAGTYHNLAIKNSKVICWGDPWYCKIPEEAKSGVTAIAVNLHYSLALKDGGVIAWGWDSPNTNLGQLNVPEEAKSGVTAMAAGQLHNMVLKDGKVIVWNYNSQGQMNIPATVKDGGITQITSTFYHNLVLR